jgi:hypothetical protein
MDDSWIDSWCDWCWERTIQVFNIFLQIWRCWWWYRLKRHANQEIIGRFFLWRGRSLGRMKKVYGKDLRFFLINISD